MANIAQEKARSSLEVLGDAKAALGAFDVRFSIVYLGNNGIGKSYDSAWRFNDNVHVGRAPVLGNSGFKSIYNDNEGDQTHHFAAHLTAGINDQLAAHRAQKVTDWRNKADRLLSNAAYKIGQDLRKDPSSLSNVGDRILRDICDKK